MDRQVAPAHQLLQIVQQVGGKEDGSCAADNQPEDVVLNEAAK